MKIFISGITGSGMGPLALFAKAAGIEVFGSDLHDSPLSKELNLAKIPFKIGPQTKDYLASLGKIDWFVHTSSLPLDHPELLYAKSKNIKISKRDELINYLVNQTKLPLIAIAGTHGKTTTTAMLIWVFKKLGIPISYLVGSTLPFGPSGDYKKNAKFFIYEADEYDRNFLHFSPWLSIITNISYDHFDTYPTNQDYIEAFSQFKKQSNYVISDVFSSHPRLTLSGEFRRLDATMALMAVEKSVENFPGIFSQPLAVNNEISNAQTTTVPKNNMDVVIDILNSFPGAGRRFEKIAPHIYSDYAHHPEEIRATILLAKEEVDKQDLSGLAVVYQPHQNIRQHQVFRQYQDVFSGVNHLFWLPTFLTREDPSLEIISPEKFLSSLATSHQTKKSAIFSDQLADQLKNLSSDHLILFLGAGSIDAWARSIFTK